MTADHRCNMLRWSLCLLLLFALPLGAEPLPGQDEPFYRSVRARLLAADDQAALRELHALAEAGNDAALLILPAALTWFPATGDFADRRALRLIDGQPLATAAAAQSPAAALWQGGAISPQTTAQLQRALGLYALGEAQKGDALLAGWFNHMPLATPLPKGFADLPAAPWLKAIVVESRLRAGDPQAGVVMAYWLAQDRIEGYMAQAGFVGAAAVGAGPAGSRLSAGQVLRERLWSERPATPLPPETVALIAAELLSLPSYAPVRAWCEARCPDTAPACAEAFVEMLGEVSPATTLATPLQEVLTAAEFFATARGERVLLEPALHHRMELARIAGFTGALTEHPAFAAATARDACLAERARRLAPLD